MLANLAFQATLIAVHRWSYSRSLFQRIVRSDRAALAAVITPATLALLNRRAACSFAVLAL